MATEVLKEFLVSLGFKVDESSFKKQSLTVKQYEKAIVSAEKAIDLARLAGAKTAEQRSKIEAELHLKGLKQGLQEARAVEENQKRRTAAIVGGLTSIAGAAATAATLVGAAMVKIAGGFDNLYFTSQRTGASVNQIKGLSYAFSQVGSTAESAMQAIESFAKTRRTNPGINGLLRSYGVDTRGDTADVLTRSVDAIQARHPYYTGSQVAGLLGISEDQFQTFTKYREEIKKFREEYARTQIALNVNSDETARSSATIQRAIGSLTATLGVLTEKLYTALAPVLERIVKGFKDWIESHPEQVEKLMQGVARAVETVGTALGQVGDWLSDETNQKRLAEFWDGFTRRVGETLKTVRDLIDTLQKARRYFGLDGAEDPLGTLATRALGNQPQVSEGNTSAGKTYTPLLQRGWNAVKRGLGFGGGDTSGTQARAPGAAGKYRPIYSLSDADLDQRVVNTIAGEVSTKNAEGVDAVINNMLNRVGTKGWGPSGNLLEVARAPGQYAGYRKASEAETEFVRSRIRAIASGGVSDNTNGSNSYRAESYYRGEGRDKTWARTSKIGPNVAGNRYGFVPGVRNGPYAPYAEPKPDAPSAPQFGPSSGAFNPSDYLKSQPMGSSSSSNDNSRTVTQNNPVTVNVQGATDPQATGTAVARAMGQANDMSLRNVQTAIR